MEKESIKWCYLREFLDEVEELLQIFTVSIDADLVEKFVERLNLFVTEQAHNPSKKDD
jgi:hypothetical protein